MPISRLLRSSVPILLAIALSLIALPAFGATIAGPPTFSVTTTVDVDRGISHPQRYYAARASRNTRASSGSSRAVLTAPAYPLPANTPTQGGGVASNTQLRSLATAGGNTAFPDNGAYPYVTARNEAVITRFFEFRSGSGAATVELEPILIFDGYLEHDVFGGDPFGNGRADVSLSLDIVSPTSQLLQRVFRVSATLLGPSFVDPTLVANAGGAADRSVWEQSLTRVSANRVEVNYLDTLENAARVPVGVPIGLRWTLETAAEFRGAFVRASVISDFHNTATLDFDFAPGDEGSSFVEILTVPEPGVGALLALGAVVAVGVRRRR